MFDVSEGGFKTDAFRMAVPTHQSTVTRAMADAKHPYPT
jgi:hypothetical protein